MIMRNIVLVVLSFFVLSCSTQTVMVDYDRQQDFNQIKTYSMHVDAGKLGELDVDRLEAAVRQTLQVKGMNYMAENADVLISIQPEEYISQNQSSNVGIGMGGGSGGFGTSVGFGIPITSEKLNQIYRFTMTTADGKMIWDGRIQLKMPVNASPETREENIRNGVARLFKNFPMK